MKKPLAADKVNYTKRDINKARKRARESRKKLVHDSIKADLLGISYGTKALVWTMVQYGFEAGANWKNFKDSPHFQIKLPYPEYNSISQSNTTKYLTTAIQQRLDIKPDGVWGRGTNEAISEWNSI